MRVTSEQNGNVVAELSGLPAYRVLAALISGLLSRQTNEKIWRINHLRRTIPAKLATSIRMKLACWLLLGTYIGTKRAFRLIDWLCGSEPGLTSTIEADHANQ